MQTNKKVDMEQAAPAQTLEYKGYTGSLEWSETDGVFFGKVLGIEDLVSYEGETPEKAGKDFRDAVKNYITIIE